MSWLLWTRRRVLLGGCSSHCLGRLSLERAPRTWLSHTVALSFRAPQPRFPNNSLRTAKPGQTSPLNREQSRASGRAALTTIGAVNRAGAFHPETWHQLTAEKETMPGTFWGQHSGDSSLGTVAGLPARLHLILPHTGPGPALLAPPLYPAALAGTR